FSFITPPEYINRIQPHSLTIRSLFNNNKLFKKMKVSFRKRNLLYIEQLLTIDSSHLLFWADLRFTTFSQGLQSTYILQWFKLLDYVLIILSYFSRDVRRRI